MAGFIFSTIEEHDDRSYDVVPEHCPAALDDQYHRPRCYTITFDGSRRACPYWYATTYVANSTERSDPSVLADHMANLGATVKRCGVLCLRARSNHRPGC
jgi:hypothetical protein